jgi:hypothetical protein
MKQVIFALLIIWCEACCCADNPASTSKLWVSTPLLAKIGDPFLLDVRMVPPLQRSVPVRLESNVPFSSSSGTTVVISPGSQLQITLKMLGGSSDGLAWIRGSTDGYGDNYSYMSLGFLGHIKSNAIGKLPYGSWSTIALALVDRDGKPLSSVVSFAILVQSTDALLKSDQERSSITLKLLRNANFTEPFQVKPISLQGGEVHLTTTLTSPNNFPDDFSLDSQYLTLQADPAWWVPLILAIGGGMIYGLYKSLNLGELPKEKVAPAIIVTLVTTAIAGLFGYLIASLDLLGLKLDPNSLRSYPLLGFLVAYIGVDPFVNKLAPKKP